MRNLHPLRAARRKMQRLQRFVSDNPMCLYCGCSDPMLLRPVTKSFLEDHHIFGRVHDPVSTVALCFNCHALVTENLKQAGVGMKPEPNPMKFARIIFRALAVHFRVLSDACWRFAKMFETAETK